MCKGFVKTPRRLFDTTWWNKRRVYTEVDAVLDLYNQANIRDRTETNGLKLKRNQLLTSQRTLAEKWIWNQPKVMRFLKKLQDDKWIKVESNKFHTIITLLEYETNDSQTDSRTDSRSVSRNVSPRPAQTERVEHNNVSQPDSRSDSRTESQSDSLLNNRRIEDNNNILLFDIAEAYPFEKFWDLYDKKVARPKAENLYAKLKITERKAIFEYIPKYKAAQPLKQYRKNPDVFLRNRSWEDEIVPRESYSHYGAASAAAQVDNSQDKFKDKEWKL